MAHKNRGEGQSGFKDLHETGKKSCVDNLHMYGVCIYLYTFTYIPSYMVITQIVGNEKSDLEIRIIISLITVNSLQHYRKDITLGRRSHADRPLDM